MRGGFSSSLFIRNKMAQTRFNVVGRVGHAGLNAAAAVVKGSGYENGPVKDIQSRARDETERKKSVLIATATRAMTKVSKSKLRKNRL